MKLQMFGIVGRATVPAVSGRHGFGELSRIVADPRIAQAKVSFSILTGRSRPAAALSRTSLINRCQTGQIAVEPSTSSGEQTAPTINTISEISFSIRRLLFRPAVGLTPETISY